MQWQNKSWQQLHETKNRALQQLQLYKRHREFNALMIERGADIVYSPYPSWAHGSLYLAEKEMERRSRLIGALC